MKSRRIFCLCAWVTMLVSSCYAHHMAVVVDKDNKVQNVTSAQLAKIVKGEMKKWPDGKNVVIVLHNSSAEEITGPRGTESAARFAQGFRAAGRVGCQRNFYRRGHSGGYWICGRAFDHRSRQRCPGGR